MTGFEVQDFGARSQGMQRRKGFAVSGFDREVLFGFQACRVFRGGRET